MALPMWSSRPRQRVFHSATKSGLDAKGERTMSERGRTISKLLSGLLAGGLLVAVTVLAFSTTAPTVKAWGNLRCDFLTGGGWIVINGAKRTFGVGGGCKNGSGTNGIPYWGHLEYQDHATGLNVHATSITYYVPDDENTVDP